MAGGILETPQLEVLLGREGDGCAFVFDEGGPPGQARRCAAPCRPGSAYCPQHHARCRLPGGSAAEERQLREIEALARAVGGKQGRPARRPPPGLLRRLARTVLRVDRSRIDPKKDGSDGPPL